MAITIGEEGLKELFPEISEIKDPELQKGVIDIWIDVAAASSWQRIEDVPKNLRDEKHRTLLDHIRGTTRIALSSADIIKELYGIPYDRDLLISACLLHDVSKLLECEPDPEADSTNLSGRPGKTSDIGKSLPHAAYAAHMILKKGLPNMLAHMVITHTHSSNMRGLGWESSLLFYADFTDTDSALLRKKAKPYSQRWKID